MAEAGKGTFGGCCEAMRDSLVGEEFEPLISVGDDEVLYMAIGLVEGEDAQGDDAGLIEHPVYFCPFCGKGVQSPEEVERKTGEAIN